MLPATELERPMRVARTWMIKGSPLLQTRRRDASVRPSDRSSDRVSSSSRVVCRRAEAPASSAVNGTGLWSPGSRVPDPSTQC